MSRLMTEVWNLETSETQKREGYSPAVQELSIVSALVLHREDRG